MDISNKTLAVLVILAIIVSLVGLFIGRARVVTVGRPVDTGIVQADVFSDVQITVDYGITFTTALLVGEDGNSEGTGVSPCGPCWAVIGSTGSTPADMSYWSETNLWFHDNAGVYDATREFESVDYQIKVEDADGTVTYELGESFPGTNLDACAGGYTIALDTYANADVQTAAEYTDVATNCQQWEGFRVGASVTVPPNEASGTRTATLTFEAVEYSP